ncbi:MAG: HlyD family efflux transporter periplasmic adaptor subunit [Planctomycetes bacterium]|nr:HlyD family efflux transporter periplasmic adaptor subunit [Planctomycetota bacterium]
MSVPSLIDGVVLRVMREDAGFVPAGSPILEIGNSEEMELKVDILSTYATKIKPCNPVLIEHFGGDHTLAGVVRIVEPSAFLKISALGVEEKRVNVIIDFNTPWIERQSLGNGFRVEAKIVVEKSSGDTVVISNGAIFRERNQRFTYRDVLGIVRKTPIQIGLAGSRETEILDGIASGDVILVYPSDKIRDGA